MRHVHSGLDYWSTVNRGCSFRQAYMDVHIKEATAAYKKTGIQEADSLHKVVFSFQLIKEIMGIIQQEKLIPCSTHNQLW